MCAQRLILIQNKNVKKKIKALPQTNISLRRDLVAKMKGLENQSLWQSLNSFVLTFISNNMDRKYKFIFEKRSR